MRPETGVCLVGRKGSGKSILLRIAAGLVPPHEGDRFAQPGATIHYLPQEPDLSGFATILAFVSRPVFGTSRTKRRLRLKATLRVAVRSAPTALDQSLFRAWFLQSLERSLIAERLAPQLAAPNLRVALDCDDENDAQRRARACYTAARGS